MAVSCYWRGLRVWASKFLFPLKIDPFFAHLYYYLKLTLQKEVKENIKPPTPTPQRQPLMILPWLSFQKFFVLVQIYIYILF